MSGPEHHRCGNCEGIDPVTCINYQESLLLTAERERPAAERDEPDWVIGQLKRQVERLSWSLGRMREDRDTERERADRLAQTAAALWCRLNHPSHSVTCDDARAALSATDPGSSDDTGGKWERRS